MTRPTKSENVRRAAPARDARSQASTDDVVLVHGRSEDGSKLAVLRKKGDAISAGVLSAVTEGTPIHGELLRLSPRADAPAVCDVEVLHDASATRSASAGDDVASERPSGPARVATAAYRDGWESIWGSRSVDAGKASGSLPN